MRIREFLDDVLGVKKLSNLKLTTDCLASAIETQSFRHETSQRNQNDPCAGLCLRNDCVSQ
eukprot:1423500-Rhodomonas_salina.2